MLTTFESDQHFDKEVGPGSREINWRFVQSEFNKMISVVLLDT